MKSISCEEKAQDKVHRVRITLSSKNVKNLEKAVCSELVNGGMNKRLRIDGDEGAPQRVSPISCRGPYEDTGTYSPQLYQRQNKKGCTNFRWSPSMSRFLLSCLIEQAKLGLKVNKTFKRQAFIAAAEAVTERFKLLCSDSNVENHLRTIKTRFLQIKRLQSLSNTKFDEKEKKIIMDDVGYGAHIAANPKDEPFLNKPIEMYDEMAIICSEDNLTENFTNYLKEDPDGIAIVAPDDVNVVVDEDFEIEEDVDETPTRSQQVPSSSASTERTGQSSRRKHNLAEKIDHLASQIGKLAEAIRISRRGISSELFAEVMKVDGYDERSLGKAFDYLHENEKLGMAFLAKNGNLRQAWLAEFFSRSGLMN
ncbi:uncharacterized protein LOC110107834 isoform X1 [Dendrobium catenatum]|uniref:uncharacterized protein LOC110107834 isoform X1 n=1 Tax=Dendrobium catenatum TaxID=906689 RepID=UPI0009F68B11|nr:uncharacterized protein LOC110107834 isoform X1 [Dendrobium catenatum]XP_020693906.1 uncharacterized protein LOC110107834 isoform X1 [Dendrobium catenatum]XP_028556567.1 uncharacterized protein LOC110107834 isoform X1 [Dendrobium catenatum]XP_028556568.1 uncharacterized protein LOC110107834 isoform X1 [Dendrobium catenatum]XP_028556569.1 uncharacterized protein LOC110107834 isoform X1 [Dendrobium catenatum]